jgi:hypothetical protein
MLTRTRSRCDAHGLRRPELPARRAGCRSLPIFVERLYIAIAEPDGETSIDVLDRSGTFVARYVVGDRHAAAEAIVRDATGHPPRTTTASAFADELLDTLPDDGVAITSSEVCAWLLLRAIS